MTIFLITYIITVIALFTIYDVNHAENPTRATFLLFTPIFNSVILLMIVIVKIQDGEDFLDGYKSIRRYINKSKYRKRMKEIDPYGEEDWED